MGFLQEIFDTLRTLVVTIPLDNVFSYLFVILGAVANLFALFAFGGTDGGGVGTGGGL